MQMAIGKRKLLESTAVLKYDARVGRLYTQDRVLERGSWQTVQSDCTDGFRALFDLQILQQGHIAFPKGAAPLAILFPAGAEIGDPPSENYKQGLRVLVKIDDDVVRELMSTAVALWSGMDVLHDDFLAAAKEHAGELPIVELVDTREIKNAGGGISHEPIFRIVDWVPRPADMPETAAPRSQSKPKPKPVSQSDLDDEVPF
jgi:hypothetical protein